MHGSLEALEEDRTDSSKTASYRPPTRSISCRMKTSPRGLGRHLRVSYNTGRNSCWINLDEKD